ncbi:Shedu anti-phage system protein SduA domain-containing protein [Flavobacterium sp. ZB4R12]|uniref:Shedu anti-phage system protein SduA domain-containing protein n=1 Tax=Flavobacterium sp. ZB4R12 TaxID=3398732 RepID=UPI003AAA85A2
MKKQTAKIEPLEDNKLILELMNAISDKYWQPLNNYIEKNPELAKTFTAFLLQQEQIVLYIGKTHLAIEYFGNETLKGLPKNRNVKVTHYDYTEAETNLFEDIVGFKFQSTLGNITMPLLPYIDDWVLPTNRGMDKLLELGWNWNAQDAILSINSPSYKPTIGQFSRIINGRFFDADDNGLKTRHIKWLDFLPLKIETEAEDYQIVNVTLTELSSLIEHDAHYIYPLPPKDDYKFYKLPQLNRFLELISNKNTTEPQLTNFLEDSRNQFILTMGFFAKEIHPQVICEWQSEIRNAIIPDFLIVKPNGFADILEFKLPNLKSKSVVGKTNRESFSAEINSYIAQSRVYKEYFEDPNNRKWTLENHKINVRHPKRILVAGRRWDFPSDVWKEIIDDYKDVEIITFDDLVDGVVSQFYM